VDRRRRTQPELEGDREPRSIALTLGSVVRAARKRARLDQDALGSLVGLHRSRISEIERGEATGTPLVVWVRLGVVLRRPLAVSFSRDLEPSTPADAAHLDGQELILRLARATGRTGMVELPTRPERPMASVDVCVRDDANRTLILQEIWNRFDDFGRAARSSDRKAAEAADLAIGLGSERPYRVALCWLLVDNAANRAMVARYPEVFAARFPGSLRKWVEALTSGRPVPAGHGMAWLDLRAGRLVPIRRRSS
jgi:transcriptional regulator with XRE-family HTH domain